MMFYVSNKKMASSEFDPQLRLADIHRQTSTFVRCSAAGPDERLAGHVRRDGNKNKSVWIGSQIIFFELVSIRIKLLKIQQQRINLPIGMIFLSEPIMDRSL